MTRCEKYRIAKGPIAGRERTKCEANEPEKQIRKGVGTDRRTLLWIRVSSWVQIREWVQIRAWVEIRIIQMYLGSHVLEELYNFSESVFHFKRTSSVGLAVSSFSRITITSSVYKAYCIVFYSQPSKNSPTHTNLFKK